MFQLESLCFQVFDKLCVYIYIPTFVWLIVFRGGLSADEEDKFVMSHFQPKKLENWEDQILNPSPRVPIVDVIKEEVSQNSNCFGHGDEDFQPPRSACSQMMPVSSPRSCVITSFTNNNNNIFDLSYNKVDARNQHPDQSSEVKLFILFYFVCLNYLFSERVFSV